MQSRAFDRVFDNVRVIVDQPDERLCRSVRWLAPSEDARARRSVTMACPRIAELVHLHHRPHCIAATDP